ncbi:hypothetical protein GGTG_05001 [Gaeumannomyces tritici R3-111a-1]|uniref:Uncharacterized protein n=1 Tax=Gaeumannomyces tritici (strain R3-111a-1) TaxID=644352 RepID=J3NUP5_GAET3|nr:hypothetical protein GGTG_05001 [Gaeumannomyces tritici R3-111a-1]EJT79919.1 hypothetical protein GGTG_05001 [Gaeumannomyces tritici R3-111a-1]
MHSLPAWALGSMSVCCNHPIPACSHMRPLAPGRLARATAYLTPQPPVFVWVNGGALSTLLFAHLASFLHSQFYGSHVCRHLRTPSYQSPSSPDSGLARLLHRKSDALSRQPQTNRNGQPPPTRQKRQRSSSSPEPSGPEGASHADAPWIRGPESRPPIYAQPCSTFAATTTTTTTANSLSAAQPSPARANPYSCCRPAFTILAHSSLY